MATVTKARATKKTAKKTVKKVAAKRTSAANGSRGMSTSHKAALAVGRNQATAIRAYLDALEANKPKRGRKVTPDTMQKRIDKLREDIKKAPKSKQLQMVQDRMDLEAALAAVEEPIDLTGLQKGFVKNARGYAKRKNISYAAFREVGVPAPVLKDAGISRSSN